MTHASYNLSVRPTNAYYGAGSDKMLHCADLITDDPPATVEAASYLNASATRLPKGTRIDAVMNAGQTTPIGKTYVVTANDGTTVTIGILETGAGGGVSPITVLNAEKVSAKASDAEVVRWVAPFKGKINKLRSVQNAVLATADATVTLAINGGAVTNGVLTIASTGAAGVVDEATPTAAHTFVAGDLITATVGGGSTATGTIGLQLELEETA
jgi:hypothetical protein